MAGAVLTMMLRCYTHHITQHRDSGHVSRYIATLRFRKFAQNSIFNNFCSSHGNKSWYILWLYMRRWHSRAEQSRPQHCCQLTTTRHATLHRRVRVNIWVGCSYEHSTAQYSTAQYSTLEYWGGPGSGQRPYSSRLAEKMLWTEVTNNIPLFHRYKANSATSSTETFPQ